MLYEAAHRDELKTWLVKSLEPICDAEPEALAAYVLALLNHDAPEQELRKEMVKQLEEFLEGGSTSFVETLFATLRSKSYIPYSTTPSEPSASSSSASYKNSNANSNSNVDSGDMGIPIPLDALLSASASNASSPGRGQKRALDDVDGSGSGYQQGPSKGARLYDNDSQSSWQNGHEMENGTVFQSREGMGRGGTRWLPNGVCRDYHIKGYCARGSTCKFSHDDAAFAPAPLPLPFNPMVGPMGMPGPMSGMPFLPMMPFPMVPVGSPTYDPNEAHMDMGPNPQNRPSHQGMGGPYGAVNGMEGQDGGEYNDIQGAGQATSSAKMLDQDVQMQNAQPEARVVNGSSLGPRGRPPRGGNPSFRGRGRGGHGTFSNDHQSFHGHGDSSNKPRNDSKTIVVEKIPAEHLSLEAVNGWFKRFGTVTNVAVDAGGAKALVSFASHEEAYAAWKAEEAVFGNRFVKVFWHRPMEGQGVAGTRALQASAGVIARENATSTNVTPPSAPTPPPHLGAPTAAKPIQSSKLSALAAKQQKLEKLIAEQKELIGKLSSAPPAEKKEIMTRLRKLDAEMSAARAEPSPAPPAVTSKNGHPLANGKERKVKELLDMELDAHAHSGGESQGESAGDSAETTESLQEKLARLREEASALGISDTSAPAYGSPAYGSSSFRGYRGRGRGRGFFRGAMRGGPPRSSMKLDNRTKSLVVKGVKAQDPESVQAVRGWYELDGQVDSVDVQDDESVMVTFRSRAAAEQALAKGSSLPPPVGSVKLSWHETTYIPKATPTSAGTADKKPSIPATEDRPPSPRPDDIPDESGWGEVDDGMGMF